MIRILRKMANTMYLKYKKTYIKYRRSHAKERAAKQRAYYKKHKNKILKQQRIYYKTHKPIYKNIKNRIRTWAMSIKGRFSKAKSRIGKRWKLTLEQYEKLI